MGHRMNSDRMYTKSFLAVKVVGSELYGKKSSHVKGWCGLGWVRSPGDFDSLDAPGSQFLNPIVKHVVISRGHRKKTKKW